MAVVASAACGRATSLFVLRGDGTGGIATDRRSAKVRRLLADDRARLQPCNSKGVVRSGAAGSTATIRLASSQEHTAVERALRKKYPIGVVAFALAARARRLRRKVAEGGEREACALVVALEDSATSPALD